MLNVECWLKYVVWLSTYWVSKITYFGLRKYFKAENYASNVRMFSVFFSFVLVYSNVDEMSTGILNLCLYMCLCQCDNKKWIHKMRYLCGVFDATRRKYSHIFCVYLCHLACVRLLEFHRILRFFFQNFLKFMACWKW